MKHIIITALLLALGLGAFAQNEKYLQRMKANIAALDSAKAPEDFIAVSAAFERIGDAEKNQWLPYYYAALAHVWRGFRDQKGDKDAIAIQASSLISKAEAIEKNAEIAIVKNMIATVQMLVDPASRYMTYGMDAAKALSEAKQLDSNNPRIYFLEGQSVMGTPPQFGGGKDKAKPLFERSLALFNSYKPASELHPVWGKAAAEKSLAQCN
jgi:hypothetical protein